MCLRVSRDRIRNDITAVLVPEPQNPYDVNAIAIRIDDRLVGHLGRAQAAAYLPGLQKRMRECGALVALRGEIVGGGYYPMGPVGSVCGLSTIQATSGLLPHHMRE